MLRYFPLSNPRLARVSAHLSHSVANHGKRWKSGFKGHLSHKVCTKPLILCCTVFRDADYTQKVEVVHVEKGSLLAVAIFSRRRVKSDPGSLAYCDNKSTADRCNRVQAMRHTEHNNERHVCRPGAHCEHVHTQLASEFPLSPLVDLAYTGHTRVIHIDIKTTAD